MYNKLGRPITTNKNMLFALCVLWHKYYYNQQPTTVSKQVEQIYLGKGSPAHLQCDNLKRFSLSFLTFVLLYVCC